MKINSKKNRNLNILATISISIILIGFFIAVINIGLNNVALPKDNVVHAEDINNNKLQTDLSKVKIIVSVNEDGVPLDYLNYQTAIAVATEVSERFFNKNLIGRIQVNLINGENPYWSVTAEGENSIISVDVDAKTGSDLRAGYDSTEDSYWDYFDIKYKPESSSDVMLDTHDIPTGYMDIKYENPEGMEELHELKKQAVIDYGNSTKNSPLIARSINLVNDLDIGNGAKAISAKLLMEGTHGGIDDKGNFYHIPSHLVEVTMDDGTFLILSIGEEDQSFRYGRLNSPFIDMYYPN